MMMNSRDKELIHAKQEGTTSNSNPAAVDNNKYSKAAAAAAAAAPSSSSSSRQWSGFKNPRIVRVSRTFGGKDRHSKVCTIRGLRDRRIRLSVPTAIQLYDLQDRLGLSQPSKVIDWLLDATKNDIDGLPPLQIPPGSFGFHPDHHHHLHPSLQLGYNDTISGQHPAAAALQSSSFAPFLDANLTLMNDGASNSLYDSGACSRDGININHEVDANEELEDEGDDEDREHLEDQDDDHYLSLEAKLDKIKYSWNINRSSPSCTQEGHHNLQYGGGAGCSDTNTRGGRGGGGGSNNNNNNNNSSSTQQHEEAAAHLAQNLFPITNLSNSTSFFPIPSGSGGSGGGGGAALQFNNNPMMAPYGYYHWDPSNLSLSQFGSLSNLPNSGQTDHHHHHHQPMALPSSMAGSQLFFCPTQPQPNMSAAAAAAGGGFPQHSNNSYNINTQQQIDDMSRQINPFQLSTANLSPSYHTNDHDHGHPKKATD